MTKPLSVQYLIRFASRDRIEEFRATGRLYMNPLRYFKDLEVKDELRSDKSEGISHSYPANKCEIFLRENGVSLPINNLTGAVTISDPSNENINIFSLFAGVK